MTNKLDDYIIPCASSIDYNNVDEVEGYSLYLIKLYESEGGLKSPRRTTPLMRNIEIELRFWCEKVRNMLSDAPLSFVVPLITAYDLPHRVVYRKAPARDFMRKIRINAIQRWAKGEKTISSAIIAKILCDEINNRDCTSLENKYGLFYFGLINDWVTELQRTGTFAGITKVETYTRLKLIMGEDLFGEYGSKGADDDKQRWAEKHIVTDLTTLDTRTLRAYIEFVMAYYETKSLPFDEYFTQYITHFTELNNRPDLNQYLHSSLSIDLAIKGQDQKEIC